MTDAEGEANWRVEFERDGEGRFTIRIIMARHLFRSKAVGSFQLAARARKRCALQEEKKAARN
jgi:hypothetical protein